MALHSLPIALFLAMAASGIGAEPLQPKPIVPQSFQWRPLPGNPALKVSWLLGAENQSGLYALRIALRQGGKIPVHTHPDVRYSTVLSGTLFVGFGDRGDETRLVAVPPGAVYLVPAGVPHYLYARDGDVVYQEGGAGPSATEFLE